jgi:hypothetical protein
VPFSCLTLTGADFSSGDWVTFRKLHAFLHFYVLIASWSVVGVNVLVLEFVLEFRVVEVGNELQI